MPTILYAEDDPQVAELAISIVQQRDGTGHFAREIVFARQVWVEQQMSRARAGGRAIRAARRLQRPVAVDAGREDFVRFQSV